MDYGEICKNWWSEKWLDNLLFGVNIGTINYGIKAALQNRVADFAIKDKRILTTVKGPKGGTHNVYLVFSELQKERADIFISMLKQHPGEVNVLLNHSMNHSLELLLNKSGINIFETIQNVNMNCDCKDAVPCKNIVAVIFKIAMMADEDPSVLFKIHGLDLSILKNLKEEMSQELADRDVPMESTLVRILPNSHRVETPRVPMFKFNEWQDYSHVLPAMLTNFPKFCPAGNFKKSFIDELERCRNFYNRFESFSQFAEDFGIYHARTFIMEKERLQLEHLNGWQWHFNQLEDDKILQIGLSVENIMGALCRMNQDCVWHNHVTVRFLHQLLVVSFYLIRCGAIYPQVFWINKSTAQIRWLPAQMLTDILLTVSELEKSVPFDFAFTCENGVLEELDSAAEHILSIFISRLLRFARTAQNSPKNTHENLLGFFFDCKSGKLAASGLGIPPKIQAWFSVYNSLEFNHKIIFVCTEVGKEIALNVFAETTAGREDLSVLFENSDPKLLPLVNVLTCVSETFAPLKGYLENRGKEPLMLYGAELKEFITYSIKKFEVFGIVTEIPASLKKVVRPESQMRLKGNLGVNAFKVSDLLDFDWEIALGEDTISAEEFLRLTKNAEGLLKYKDNYVEYTADDIELLKLRLDKSTPKAASEIDDENEKALFEAEKIKPPSTAKLLQACLIGNCDGVPITMTDSLKNQLEKWREDTDIELPVNLNATLRPYQKRGYSWMYKNLQMGFGCILADDMGLGKTLQVITFLLKIKQEEKLKESKAIVVVPAGLLCNWQMEIKKFAAELSVFAYHGGKRNLENFNDDILITTYGTFRQDFKKLCGKNWAVVIIDEAQNIKNAESDQSRKIRAMKAPMKIAMSGTPVENRLLEFWTIMDFCNPGFLPHAKDFRDKFETPIQKNGNKQVAENFKRITAPFMLRRMKTDKTIISDLPDKIQQDEYAELTKSQAALYKKTLDTFLEELQRLKEGDSLDINGENKEKENSLFKRKGIILQMILALKQICNHPVTFLKKGEALVENSGKLSMLLDLLQSIQELGEKTIIFTQFREMGELLQTTLERELGITADFYHGGCTQNKRNEMVKNFQENPETKVLILSLKAAGTGLNLTAASQVIHYDLWWNPAIEAQATDRAFRIGQTKNVQVHRFITKGTFEEKINALLEAKKTIAQMTVNAGETWLADMNDDELSKIFTLEATNGTV